MKGRAVTMEINKTNGIAYKYCTNIGICRSDLDMESNSSVWELSSGNELSEECLWCVDNG